MSGMEYWEGTATKVSLNGLSIEEWSKRFLGGRELPSYASNYTEQLLDEHYGEFVLLKGELWDLYAERFDPYNLAQFDRISETEFNFRVAFHNGGTDLGEVLEGGLP